jgi:hypothetical protein
MDLFERVRNSGEDIKYFGPFAGFGLMNDISMITFDINKVKVSALICSSNKTKGNYILNEAKNISCSTNVSNNQDIFKVGIDTIVICPKTCEKHESKVYGDGLYHGDSSICRAALHQGVLKENSKVIVRVQSNGEKYDSNLQNGIKSESQENNGLLAFIVVQYYPDCPYKNKNKKLSFMEQENNSIFINDDIKAQELINSLYEDNKKIEKEEKKNNFDNKLNTLNKMRFNQKNLNKKFPGLDALGALSLNSLVSNTEKASKDILGLFGGKGNNVDNSNASHFQSIQPNSGNSSNLNSEVISPNDISASLSSSTGTGGTYNMGTQQLSGQNSISNPIPNMNINLNNGGPNPYDNIPLAFSKPQTSSDPNLLSSISSSSLNSNINLSTSIEGGNPTKSLEAYQVPDNLLGTGALKAGIDVGASNMDLSHNKNLIVDPTMSSESSENKELTFSVETTQTATEELNRFYESSTSFYINNLTEKSIRLSNKYQNFESALNHAIYSTSGNNIKASEFSTIGNSNSNNNKYSQKLEKISLSQSSTVKINPVLGDRKDSNLTCSIFTILGKNIFF